MAGGEIRRDSGFHDSDGKETNERNGGRVGVSRIKDEPEASAEVPLGFGENRIPADFALRDGVSSFKALKIRRCDLTDIIK